MGAIVRVAIIGAGPSGIAAAKYLVAEKRFALTIFEQRSNVGGLWNYTPTRQQHNKIPPSGKEDLTSPVYDRLETNIPRGLMGFSDLDWPADSQLFPKHETVLKYIEQYAAEIRHLISFDTEVQRVVPLSPGWQVDSSRGSEVYDAVLVANGHFNVPYMPQIEGMAAWQDAYRSISHSKFYRRPEDYAGKKVIVVGNSASGVDIGAQIRHFCCKPLIQSSTSASFLSPDVAGDLEKPQIVKYEVADRTVHFADGSKETQVDAVLYCTGYLYSYPFLKLETPVVTTGERVERLYKHIFYQPDPTLAFVVLNQKVIPFPVAEVQAAVIARVWAGRLQLPPASEMASWEAERLGHCERTRDFHVLKFPKDAEYINELHNWAAGALGGGGKVPPRWDEQAFWTREQFPAIKKAFNRLGSGRHEVRTLSELGFEYTMANVSKT